MLQEPLPGVHKEGGGSTGIPNLPPPPSNLNYNKEKTIKKK